jgi:tRNA pseudouridine38-40 synthase
VPRYAIEFEYDGRAFVGTQAQATGLRTLQGVLNVAIAALDPEPHKVRLASRLDAGVSARGLVGDVFLNKNWQELTLGMAITGQLPRDVVVRRVAIVNDNWNAKSNAKTKTYHYHIVRRNVRTVLDHRAWWVRRMDYPERLHELAELLPGDQDLSGFACLRHDDSDDEDPHRRIKGCHWSCEKNNGQEHWLFTITGEGFLYKQVRGLVGAMVYAAQGRASITDFKNAIIAGRKAERLGNIAPAEGLILDHIYYDPEPRWVVI